MRRALLALSALLAVPAAGETHAVALRGGVWSSIAVADCKGVERAWVWSDDAPPRSANTCEAPEAAKRRLELQVVRTGPRAKPVVIAAPAAMWREVPEGLLPRFEIDRKGVARVPHDGASAWRARAVETSEGSAWIDIAATRASAVIATVPAAARMITLLAPGGEPASGARTDVLGQRGSAMPEVVARFVADAKGRVTIPALPDAGPLRLVIRHDGAALDSFSTNVAELPLTRRLQSGSAVRGRFAAGDDPVAGVAVAVEGFVAGDVAHVFTEKTTAGNDGAFLIEHLPRRQLIVTATKSGFLPHRATIETDRDAIDLGTIQLERGASVALTVTDDQEQILSGATVDAGQGRTAVADAKGIARLSDVPANHPFRVTVAAKHHLAQTTELRPPFEDVRVRLPRAFVVKGRVVDADRLPVHATMRIESGNSYTVDETGEDGAFEAALAPSRDVKIAFSSASTSEIAVPVAGGNGGEVRELGTIAAPRGLVVAGRIVAADGTPVAGARVWTPKQSDKGPLIAFMNGELVEASSGADGAFAVSGLKAAPLLLRIDAPGLARAYRSVQLDGSLPRIELGDVALDRGSTLRVKTRAADATARVDLRGDGIDIDMLSAAVREGSAVLPHVPLGNVTLAIVRDRRTVCGKQLTIADAEESVECNPLTTNVRGNVVVGTSPARGGTLVWSSATAPKAASAILERTTASGLRMQQAWGVGDAPVMVTVDDRGRFETSELRPGRWNVSLGGAAQQIDIAAEEQSEVALRFADTLLSGIVVDSEGKPQPRVVVQIASASAFMASAEDGTFAFRGLAAGEYEVRARGRDGRTATERARIEDGRESPPVRLVLGAERPAEIRISVLRVSGEPAAGAFVFVDLESEGQRILTTDAAGAASLHVPDAVKRFRIAAFGDGTWAFGTWREPAPAAIRLERGGGFTIIASAISGDVEIIRADGWNVSQLLRRLGAAPRIAPDVPLVVGGLAPGSYTVAAGGKSAQVEVSASQSREVKLR